MVGPARALALVLVASAALAQAPVERARREQRVTVTGSPDEPLPELRVAPELATAVFFDAEISPSALEVDRARVKVLGSGPLFLILQPVVPLGAGERVILRVPYVDGQAPGQAVLALVTHPSEVDSRVEVARRAPSASACEAELARLRAQDAQPSPLRFIQAGKVGNAGVQLRKIEKCVAAPATPGWKCSRGRAYVADGWTLWRVVLSPSAGPSSWRPREATLRETQGGAPLRVRAVETAPSASAPGEVTVFVESDALGSSGLVDYTLELRGGEGRGATFTLIFKSPEGKTP